MFQIHFKNTNDKIKSIEPSFHLGCFYMDDKIIIDYPIIRKTLKSESEKNLIQHIKSVFSSSSDKVDIHLNMKKFTTTDAVTYIHLINQLVKILSSEYPDKLNMCYVYHSTPVLNIYSLFNDSKLIFVN
jgi:hypothetical protein